MAIVNMVVHYQDLIAMVTKEIEEPYQKVIIENINAILGMTMQRIHEVDSPNLTEIIKQNYPKKRRPWRNSLL